jgi:hypothetical protein
LARELVILPRFKRDYRSARKHPEFEAETLEYIFEVMISGAPLPEAFREHRLDKRGANWAGLTGPLAYLSRSARGGDFSSHRDARPIVCTADSPPRPRATAP